MLNALMERIKRIKHGQWLLALLAASIALALLAVSPSPVGQASDLEARLSGVLSQIDGAGKVEVAIYYPAVSETGWGVSNASEPPSGALIVAEGAGRAEVRLSLLRAVCTLLSLDASQVEVFEMEAAP